MEVFFDNSCGCQLQTYLGNAINGGTNQWSFSGGSIPSGGFCTPGSALVGGGTCPPSGLNSVTATRTTSPGTPGRTSEPMSCSPTILPVDLLSFTAKRFSKDEAILEWVTTNEKNSNYFQLLRSTDGNKFTPIANITSTGNSLTVVEYNYIDKGLINSGTYYYMLIQVDIDGKESMKGIVKVDIHMEVEVEIIPNIVSDGMPIKLLNFGGVELLSVSLVDLNGKTIFSINNISEKEFDIQTLGVSSALYLVKILTENEVITRKVIIQ